MDFLPIYKRDNAGNIRVWHAEIKSEGDRGFYRSVSGLENGQKVTSEWKETFPKNVGRKNGTTAVEQAESEVNSLYEDRLSKGYFYDKENIDSFEKFKPMLAQDYAKLKKPLDFENEEEEIYSQPKLDGIRCIARDDGLWTRAGKEIVSSPHVFEALKSVFEMHPDVILDGELYNHQLRDDFNKITSLVRKTKPTEEDIAECAKLVEYHVYDIPSNQKFIDRWQWLYDQGFGGGAIKVVKTRKVRNQEDLDDAYGKYLEDGYEGQIIRLNNVYENKRSKFLLKRKEFITDEFPVIDTEEGKGNWAGHVKIFKVEYAPGKVCGAGVRGTQDVLKDLMDKPKPNWCTLRYFTPTPDGVPRFPVVVDWGWGKRED